MSEGNEDDAEMAVEYHKRIRLPGLDSNSEKSSIISKITSLHLRLDTTAGVESEYEISSCDGLSDFENLVATNTCNEIMTERQDDVEHNSEMNVKMLCEVKKHTLIKSQDIPDDLKSVSGISSLLNFTGLNENDSFYISNPSLIEPMDLTKLKSPAQINQKEILQIKKDGRTKEIIKNKKTDSDETENQRIFHRPVTSHGDRQYDYSDKSDEDFSVTGGSDYDPDTEDIISDDSESHRKKPKSNTKLSFSKDMTDDSGSKQKNKLKTNDTNGQPTNQNKKRIWNRKNACVYCDQLVTNFSRHILRNHSNEKEVLQYMSVSDPDPKIKKSKRQKITDDLRNRGNFKHNSRVAYEKEGDLLPRKRNTSLLNSPSDFVTCKNCLGTFKRSTFYRHFKNCGENDFEKNYLPNSYKHRVLRSKSIAIVPNLTTASKELKEQILPRLRADKVSLIVKTDALILAYGSRLLKKKKERRSRKAICSKMRDLAMLLISVREKDNEVQSLQDVIEPSKYEAFIEAVKSMSGFDEETGYVKVISIPARIRPAIIGCIDILYTQMIMSDNSTAYKDAYKKKMGDFKQLLEINWQWEISSNAEKTRKRLNMIKENVLPLDEDIEKVTKKIHELEAKYSLKLKKDINIIDYEHLCIVTIAHIILLDRKRAGDAAEAELTFYINRKNDEIPKKILQSLTPKQRQSLDELEIFQIPGKRTRSVPILLTKTMRENIDIIISCRPVLKIPSTNPYLFARPLTNEPFDGGKCLDKVKKMCNLKKPEMLTSTGIRHHIATMSQIEARQNDNYTEQLAGFLGHDMAVHSKNYRLPLQIIQKAVVGTKLMEYEKTGLDKRSKNNYKINSSKKTKNNETIGKNLDFEGISEEIIETGNGEEKNISQKDPEKLIHEKRNEEETGKNYYTETEIKQSKLDSRNQYEKVKTLSLKCSERGTEEISEIGNKERRRETRKYERKMKRKNSCQDIQNFRDSTDEERGSFDDKETDGSEYEVNKKTSKLQQSDSNSNESEGQPEIKTQRRKVIHKKWTDKEIKAVKKHFTENIEKKINPGKAKCTTVLNKEPVLHQRTWMQLNTYVNNIYKKKNVKYCKALKTEIGQEI